MDTDEAFEHLLTDKSYLWERTGLNDSYRRSLLSKMRNNRPVEISLGKKMEILEKAGFYKTQEVAWGLKGGFERD